MTDSARPGATPWIVAGALGTVAIALAAVIIFVIHPDRNDRQKLASSRGLTAVQQHAVDAATQEALNLTTYSRKNFEADYQRTVAGSTAALKSDLANTQRKNTLLAQMQAGKFDLSGSVADAAFETSTGSQYSVLVLTLGFQVSDAGKRTQTTTNRFRMTLQHAGGSWLVSDLQDVGLI